MRIFMPKKIIFGLIATLLLFMVSTPAYSKNDIAIKEQLTSLGKVPDNFNIIAPSVKFSPDLKHVTYVAYKDYTHAVVCLDKLSSPEYYSVPKGMPKFSPANRHAYIAYKYKNSDAIVVVDWKPDTVIGEVDHFIFSPDGLRYAYRAGKNKQQCVVIDGKPQKWYTGIPIKKNFVFSPDSKHMAYVAYSDNSCFLVCDGQEKKQKFEFIDNVTFSPDSKNIAYTGRIAKKEKNANWCVINNGKRQNEYSRIFSLIFSPDSKHLAYVAVKNGKMVLIVDGQEKESHDQYGLPTFSGDSKTFAYSYANGNNFHIVVNSKEGPAFASIYTFFFSPDASRYAYIAGNKGKWQCVVDGSAGPSYKEIAGFKFSWDSSRYAYGASTNKGGVVVINGKPQMPHLSVGEPYISNDSKHTVYRALVQKEGKWITILDGKKTGDYYLSIGKYNFSITSQHLAYSALVSPNKSIMIVDGKKECEDQNFIRVDTPYFSIGDSHVAYIAASAKAKKGFSIVVDGHVLANKFDAIYKGMPINFDSPNHFHTIGIQNPGPEFLLIDVDIPPALSLKTDLTGFMPNEKK